MPNEILGRFVAKLERRQQLPPHERFALLSLQGEHRGFPAGATVIASGQPSTHCVLLGDGLLSCQKVLANGSCQILAVHLAGDAVDLQSIFFEKTDYAIRSHSATSTLWINCDQILKLSDAYPLIAKVLWLDCLADASIFREWTANLGQRTARERIAHFLVEMAARHDAVGKLQEDAFDLALSQKDLSHALGLSLVHINKSLRTLRDERLVQIKGRRITLVDRSRLEELAGFDRAYLHLDGNRVKKLKLSPAGSTDAASDLELIAHSGFRR